MIYRDRINLKLHKPDELKDVIGSMSKLRQEMMTNKVPSMHYVITFK